MLSPTDAAFSIAFDRKILIEEDSCFSSERIWVAAVILTVYNEKRHCEAHRMVHREKGLPRETGSCVERSQSIPRRTIAERLLRTIIGGMPLSVYF